MEGPWGALHETFNAFQLRSVLLCSACSQAQTSPSSSTANWIVFQCSQFSPAEAFGKAFSIHIQNRHSIHIRLICLFHYFHSASWNHHGVFPSQGPVSFLGRWMAPGPDNPTSQLLPIIRKSGWSGTEKEERKKDMVEAGRSFEKLYVKSCVWQSCVWKSCVWKVVSERLVSERVVSERVVCEKLFVTKLCVKELCMTKLFLTKLCVKDCVSERVVSERVLCERLFVTKLCVKELYDKVVCDKAVCERLWLCVWQSCVWKSCVWKVVSERVVCVCNI